MDRPSITFASELTDGFTLNRDAQQRLVLIEAGGEQHAGVEPVRCFPISRSEQWIAICDAQGHELRCVRDLAALPAATRTLLEDELARNEFVPQVLRIIGISDDAEYAEWEVETNRGSTIFRINSEDAVRKLDDRRVMIIDAAGIRYMIPEVRKLDRASRRLLDRYV